MVRTQAKYGGEQKPQTSAPVGDQETDGWKKYKTQERKEGKKSEWMKKNGDSDINKQTHL
jgi:hypothetical protein